jgi:uncharacterized protein YegL/uncharacterized Zn-finger protein
MRRLPVFLILDVSDSMIGEPHRYLEAGVEALTRKLRQDPQALETVHLSIIAFAGQVKTIVPLIDLPTFYAPKLPIGSGTSVGAALEHLMNEIDKNVIPTTPTRKGDWKPVIYFLTDGKPTDKYQDAIKKWQEQYAKRCQMIVIGLGQYADLSALAGISNDAFVYNGEQEADFARFIQWMTLSVKSQSVAVEQNQNSTGCVSLDKAGGFLEKFDFNSTYSDQDCVVFVGRCQKFKKPYLIKYDRMPSLTEMGLNLSKVEQEQKLFHITGGYPIDEDYFVWSESKEHVNPVINVKNLVGGVGCPYCGNYYALGVCSCGSVFCVGDGVEAQCPWCDTHLQMQFGSDSEGFEVTRSKG